MSRPSSKIHRPEEHIGSSVSRIPAGTLDPSQVVVRVTEISQSAIMITRFRKLNLKLVYQFTNNNLRVEMSAFGQIFDRDEPLHLLIIARDPRVCTRAT